MIIDANNELDITFSCNGGSGCCNLCSPGYIEAMKIKIKKGDLLIGKLNYEYGYEEFVGYYLSRKGDQIRLSSFYPPIKLGKITECHYVYEDKITKHMVIISGN